MVSFKGPILCRPSQLRLMPLLPWLPPPGTQDVWTITEWGTVAFPGRPQEAGGTAAVADQGIYAGDGRPHARWSRSNKNAG